jgi:hypothetical protein
MWLLLVVSDKGPQVGLISARQAEWFRSRARDPFPLLERAFKKLPAAKRRRLAGVVCALPSGQGSAKVSWSAVRAGVALTNALAFGLGMPVAELAYNGDESRDELAAAARTAAKKAKSGAWIKAKYSGKPNITKSNKKW